MGIVTFSFLAHLKGRRPKTKFPSTPDGIDMMEKFSFDPFRRNCCQSHHQPDPQLRIAKQTSPERLGFMSGQENIG